ncbi:hypothetical protein VKT23_006322 [Stygiomarasmius scandens]|uniref:Uncharacterized protein n=1 Tax=Marasmiellus scandens TaxID=2682957 RepID=A0ABR1JTR9_9AGAR
MPGHSYNCSHHVPNQRGCLPSFIVESASCRLDLAEKSSHHNSDLTPLLGHSRSTDSMKRRHDVQTFSDFLRNIAWIFQRPDSRTRWEDVRGQITALTAEATIATFLAGVQGTILILSVNNATTTSSALIAAKTLSFMGILFDVISAFLALLSSTLLQAKISEVQRLLDGIDHMSFSDLTKLQHDVIAYSDPLDPIQKFLVDTPLWESLRFEVLKRIMSRMEELRRKSASSGESATVAAGIISSSDANTKTHLRAPESHSEQTQSRSSHGNGDLSSIIDTHLRKIRAEMEEIDAQVEGLYEDLRNLTPEVSEIQQACQRIENIGSVGDAAGTSILCGGLVFGSSAVCLSISTQPVEVWAPTVVACGCVIVLPGANMLLKYFGVRLPTVFDTI